MKSNLLSKSDTNAIIAKIEEQLDGIEIPHPRNARIHKLDDASLIDLDGRRILEIGGKFVPFLGDTEIIDTLPSVTVDMGAVRFMCNGANVMRPGVTETEEFDEGALVRIIEVEHHKVLAVGRARLKSTNVPNMKFGEVAKNMHYISDKYWELAKSIS